MNEKECYEIYIKLPCSAFSLVKEIFYHPFFRNIKFSHFSDNGCILYEKNEPNNNNNNSNIVMEIERKPKFKDAILNEIVNLDDMDDDIERKKRKYN